MTKLTTRLEQLEGQHPATDRPVRYFVGYEGEDSYSEGDQRFTQADIAHLESQGVDINVIQIAYVDMEIERNQHGQA